MIIKSKAFGNLQVRVSSPVTARPGDTLTFTSYSSAIPDMWQHSVFPPVATFDEAQTEVFKTPISHLRNLWYAKFGYEWQRADEVYTDNFYKLACARLANAGELESAVHTDSGIVMVRAIPRD